ncbi:unnamed protein product [Lathyrus sativus]|nr:unnamed protein product [Lathyrus sativus]
MTKSGHQKKRNEEVKYCVRPAKTNKVRLRIHHRGQLVEQPIKWCVTGVMTELKHSWDVDYMSYMNIQDIIKNEGYVNIKCIWY